MTYRQLRYWTKTGRARTSGHFHNPDGTINDRTESKSGVPYGWKPDEAAILRVVVSLVTAGVGVDAAFALARTGGIDCGAVRLTCDVAA